MKFSKSDRSDAIINDGDGIMTVTNGDGIESLSKGVKMDILSASGSSM